MLHGRADKKFCNDLCRNNYNNQLNSNSYNLVRNINNVLRRNRRIMEELNPGGKTRVSREKMLQKGFDFDYFTSSYQTQAGARYYYCYEYGYLPLDTDDVLLVISKKETDKFAGDAHN
ncbi:hypothetical protein [Mucilaginibacter sp. 14171R-50]|uniref:hypothetical protein n=1 Tax=Mucilaginibacter sp. 14171R-50 TaxID=2703789 RepID=UPI001EE4A5D1|nr:hypothetical protein [Mucilaginibacter sp. 14171R-50]